MHKRTSTLFVLSASALALTVGAALASDEHAEQWNGFYLGVNAGALDTNMTVRDETQALSDVRGSGPAINDLTGTVGLHAGYNWQFGHVVLGLEGDVWWTDAGRAGLYDSIDHFKSGETTFGGSVRGRLGLAQDNGLIYVTTGWGYVDTDLLLSDTDGSALSAGETVQSSGFSAFVAGIGAEMKLTSNISARLEFLEYFLAEEAQGCSDLSCGPDEAFFGGSASTLRLGLSYHFGDHVEPDRYSTSTATDIWSGFYAGIHAGFADTQTSVQDDGETVMDPEGVPVFTNDLGPIAGIHAGFQKQFGSAVVGIEGDYTLIDAGADRGIDTRSAFPDYTLASQIDGFGSLRARLGVTAGNALVYATGGLGYVDYAISASDQDENTGIPEDGEQIEINEAFAIVAGVGAEVKVASNLSARFEYLFYQLDEESATCAGASCTQPTFADGNIHLARVGLTYLFNNNVPSADSGYAADWAGAYVGGHLGFLQSQTGTRDENGRSIVDDEGGTVFGEDQTFAGGVFLGYNHQIGNAVFGVEADYAFANVDARQSLNDAAALRNSSVNGFGSIRGRLGLATGQALFYTTAGVGYVDARSTLEDLGDPTGTRVEHDGFLALVAGAGAEFQLTENWSARGEYLYYGFDEQSDICATCETAAFADGELHTFRIGAAYRF